MVVAGLGLPSGWNTAYHFSFQLSYTNQVGVVEYIHSQQTSSSQCTYLMPAMYVLVRWLIIVERAWASSILLICYFSWYTARFYYKSSFVPRLLCMDGEKKKSLVHTVCTCSGFLRKLETLVRSVLLPTSPCERCMVLSTWFLTTHNVHSGTPLNISVLTPSSLLCVFLTNLHVYCWDEFLWCYNEPQTWRSFRDCT